MAVELKTERKFDTSQFRHYINDWNSVMHCHHYAALYTQLADDAGDLFDGHGLLYAAAEGSIYPVFNNYFSENNITEVDDRVAIIEQLMSFTGMGQLKITNPSSTAGTAEMPQSHVDSGWIKKWGNREKPINSICCGYLAAAFSALHNLPEGSFTVTETQAIVTGADKSIFTITKK